MKNKYISTKIILFAVALAGLAGFFSLPDTPVKQIPRPVVVPVEVRPGIAVKNTEQAPSATPTKRPEVPVVSTRKNDKSPAAASPSAPSAPQTTEKPPLYASDILKSKPFEEKPYYVQTIPNDPLTPQWFSNTIEADQVWSITNSRSVTLAIIDTGFALNHEEFTNRWAINDGEQGTTRLGDRCWIGTPASKQTNNCDDDNNGYADDWRGWDFNADTNNPQAGTENPSGGGVTHGTMVAGLATASGNNAKGIAGLNWNARIMPLKAMSDNGSGYTSNIVAAIEYAVDNGADVINMSLGGPAYDAAMDAAVTYAENHGVSVVAAAGNCAGSTSGSCSGSVLPGNMLYPALYTNVISVGATTSSDARAYFSSYGPSLDIVAPGSGISYSTSWSAGNPTSAYASGLNGTSFASPIVAGIVSLMKANAPNILPFQIRNILAETTDRVAGMGSSAFTNEYGYGRVNAFKAVAAAAARPSILTIASTNEPSRFAVATVHAAFGQPGGRLAKTTDRIPVYCSTQPGTTCTVTFVNKATAAKTSLQATKADAQGIDYIVFDPFAAGEYFVYANDNELASAPETVIVQ